MSFERPKQTRAEEMDTDEGRTERVAQAASGRELYQVLDQIGSICGRDGIDWTPDELQRRIDLVFEGKAEPNVITTTYGLREKVTQLLNSKTF